MRDSTYTRVLSVIRNMATPIGVNDPVRPNISATL